MEIPGYYREQAERCFRLARDAFDPAVARQLRALGREFLARAVEQESVEKASREAA